MRNLKIIKSGLLTLVALTSVALVFVLSTFLAATPSSATEPTPGSCPDGFVLTVVTVGSPGDRNGNGLVCEKTDPNHIIIDDFESLSVCSTCHTP